MSHGPDLFNEGKCMPDIVQIVGYKNTGKTTLVNLLVHYFSKQKIKVGTLKHHGHGGDIELPEKTDSTSQFEAGSLISGVEGESLTQLTFDNLPFDELINLYTLFPIDLLLIEGYKEADYPKIVLLKNAEELSLLDELSHIIAVGTQDISIPENYLTFDSTTMEDHIAEIASYITDK